jgi:hypothetical protein
MSAHAQAAVVAAARVGIGLGPSVRAVPAVVARRLPRVLGWDCRGLALCVGDGSSSTLTPLGSLERDAREQTQHQTSERACQSAPANWGVHGEVQGGAVRLKSARDANLAAHGPCREMAQDAMLVGIFTRVAASRAASAHTPGIHRQPTARRPAVPASSARSNRLGSRGRLSDA